MKNKIDLIVAEIGSTITVVNAFNLENPSFLGQGQARTSVHEGDVNIGLTRAMDRLAHKLGIEDLDYKELMATSSAAGGLRMTVHGLVYDMTVKAAKEAALGAGANIQLITAGRLRASDLEEIKAIKPNIILIAGGVDYGERDTALYNSQAIADLKLHTPIIYGGNIENHQEVRNIFRDKPNKLYIVDNVYPEIDLLNIEPSRKVIQEVFEEHIVEGPGMGKIRELVKGSIMPTPGAVMEASIFLYKEIGNLLTIDVGGATTDIQSVCEESEEISRMLLSPEPFAKRTVEGDLGLYINLDNLIDLVGRDRIKEELGKDNKEISNIIDGYKYIPKNKDEGDLIELMAYEAAKLGLYRHSGFLKESYGPRGRISLAQGKDLTTVNYIIGTGGALTNLPGSKNIIEKILQGPKDNYLLPSPQAEILVDKDYIMASLGLMSKKYPDQSLAILRTNFGLKE